jgi:hypothetical protein
MYILVFDPSDRESRSAYQMAQSIARSATAGSTGGYRTQETRDPLSSTGTRQSPTGQRDLQPTSGTPGATPGTDRQQDSQRDLTRPSDKSSGTGENVKITGRVIQSNGVQAIAVQKVERQHSGSTASVDRN